MAIAFDAATSPSPQLSGDTLTFSHTCTGSDRILWVNATVIHSGADSDVSGVTYNGVAMTQVGSDSNRTGDGFQMCSLWMLVNPASGAHDVVITGTNTPFAVLGGAVSYTGAAQSGQPDAHATGSTTATADYSVAVTVVAADCWVIFAAKNDSGAASAGSGTTSRVASANGQSLMDSGGTVSTGAISLHSTLGGAANWNGVSASFKPVGAGGSALLLRMMSEGALSGGAL